MVRFNKYGMLNNDRDKDRYRALKEPLQGLPRAVDRTPGEVMSSGGGPERDRDRDRIRALDPRGRLASPTLAINPSEVTLGRGAPRRPSDVAGGRFGAPLAPGGSSPAQASSSSRMADLEGRQDRERAALLESQRRTTGAAVQDAEARAGLGGLGLSDAASGLVSDTQADMMRQRALQTSDLEREQEGDRFRLAADERAQSAEERAQSQFDFDQERAKRDDEIRFASLEEGIGRDLNDDGVIGFGDRDPWEHAADRVIGRSAQETPSGEPADGSSGAPYALTESQFQELLSGSPEFVSTSTTEVNGQTYIVYRLPNGMHVARAGPGAPEPRSSGPSGRLNSSALSGAVGGAPANPAHSGGAGSVMSGQRYY